MYAAGIDPSGFASSRKAAHPAVPLFAGGIAGCLSWLVLFPVDLIKSRAQRDALHPTLRHTKFIEYYRQLLNSSTGTGLLRYRVFYSGIVPTLVRAFPIHSLNFFVYESCMSFIATL
jgi:hypothetical protein